MSTGFLELRHDGRITDSAIAIVQGRALSCRFGRPNPSSSAYCVSNRISGFRLTTKLIARLVVATMKAYSWRPSGKDPHAKSASAASPSSAMIPRPRIGSLPFGYQAVRIGHVRVHDRHHHHKRHTHSRYSTLTWSPLDMTQLVHDLPGAWATGVEDEPRQLKK